MDNVNKAHNLSAILRSCDVVGIGHVQAVSYRKYIHARQNNAGAGASKWTKLHLYHDIATVYEKLAQGGMQILVATNKEDVLISEMSIIPFRLQLWLGLNGTGFRMRLSMAQIILFRYRCWGWLSR